MSLPECLLVLVAGAFAGTINTVVGSGTLVTFPVLLAVGYSPVVANVSNTLGLVPGSVSGAIGYREELAGQRTRVLTLGYVAQAASGVLWRRLASSWVARPRATVDGAYAVHHGVDLVDYGPAADEVLAPVSVS